MLIGQQDCLPVSTIAAHALQNIFFLRNALVFFLTNLSKFCSALGDVFFRFKLVFSAIFPFQRSIFVVCSPQKLLQNSTKYRSHYIHS